MSRLYQNSRVNQSKQRPSSSPSFGSHLSSTHYLMTGCASAQHVEAASDERGQHRPDTAPLRFIRLEHLVAGRPQVEQWRSPPVGVVSTFAASADLRQRRRG